MKMHNHHLPDKLRQSLIPLPDCGTYAKKGKRGKALRWHGVRRSLVKLVMGR